MGKSCGVASVWYSVLTWSQPLSNEAVEPREFQVCYSVLPMICESLLHVGASECGMGIGIVWCGRVHGWVEVQWHAGLDAWGCVPLGWVGIVGDPQWFVLWDASVFFVCSLSWAILARVYFSCGVAPSAKQPFAL